MVDIVPIKQAMDSGYNIYWHDGLAWYSREDVISGPFDTLDGAAYAALSANDISDALAKFDRAREKNKKTKRVEVVIDTGFVECFHEFDLDVDIDAAEDEIGVLVQEEVDRYITVTWEVV